MVASYCKFSQHSTLRAKRRDVEPGGASWSTTFPPANEPSLGDGLRSLRSIPDMLLDSRYAAANGRWTRRSIGPLRMVGRKQERTCSAVVVI